MSLTYAWNAVRDFHRAFNHPAPDQPTEQEQDRVEKRSAWILEEVEELNIATNCFSNPLDVIIGQADAYIDQIYFGLGGLVELGVEPGPLFDIVHSANMAKLGPDGEVLTWPDGKTRKPDGWKSPEPWLEEEIKRQMRIGSGKALYQDQWPVAYKEDLLMRLASYTLTDSYAEAR